MLSTHSKVRTLARDLVEALGRIVLGEPARIVSKSALERLERLAYREQLKDAARSQNTDFINGEIQRNQLSAEERSNIARHHTPISEWPETDPDLMAPDLFASTESQHNDRHESPSH